MRVVPAWVEPAGIRTDADERHLISWQRSTH